MDLQRVRISLVFFLIGVILSSPAAANPLLILQNDSNGMTYLSAHAVPLSDLLLKISQMAGFKLHLVGELNIPVTVRFSSIAVSDAIRRLLHNHSVAILYDGDPPIGTSAFNLTIAEVWVYSSLRSMEEIPPRSLPSPREDNTLAAGIPGRKDAREQGLMQQFDDASVAQWVRMMAEARDGTIRQQVITELQRMGSQAAVAAIGVALEDSSVPVRQHAVKSLGNIHGQLATRFLAQTLYGDKNPAVRLTAVKVLSTRNDELSRVILTSVLQDKDFQVQSLARESLKTGQ